jgi:hypothetical protein
MHFEVDYLDVSRVKGNKKRKSSFQELDLKVVYNHKMPDAFLKNQSDQFVLVLPKFVLGDDEKLQIELKELKGGRSVVLETYLSYQ